MHRTHCLTLLSQYNPRDERDTYCRDRMQNFIESNPDCFKRELKVGHMTGSAWLVNRARDSVLLTHHKKLGRWMQLGGHADGETNLYEVALREAREESGISLISPLSGKIFDIDIHSIPERKGEPEHLHYDVRFAFCTVNDDTFAVSDESHELAWVPIREISKWSQEDSVLRMAKRWADFVY